MALVNLTANQINKIQIDEGIVVINLGETNELVLGPTRGGAEFTVTPSIRDIEFDGRRGKTKGLQVKDGEDVELKVNTLNCSQEILQYALNGSSATGEGKDLAQGGFGVIQATSYLTNVAVITKTIDGKFKILKVMNPMHESAFTFKAASKSENEHNLDFLGHYDALNQDTPIWTIVESATNPVAA